MAKSSRSSSKSTNKSTNRSSNRPNPLVPKASVTRSGRRSYCNGGKIK